MSRPTANLLPTRPETQLYFTESSYAITHHPLKKNTKRIVPLLTGAHSLRSCPTTSESFSGQGISLPPHPSPPGGIFYYDRDPEHYCDVISNESGSWKKCSPI
ncbi:hypothetical protein AVEN_107089-1 [Araneus ventricosus]|uniref:Uncharacterized protein n=1 Tax=Araneus ventricosus TaxID=182803 RepID=A0A4Y2WE67_ARAVE|nr:hypothetical protein AVEN_107089-1 [Araneus ventricosus]